MFTFYNILILILNTIPICVSIAIPSISIAYSNPYIKANKDYNQNHTTISNTSNNTDSNPNHDPNSNPNPTPYFHPNHYLNQNPNLIFI